MRSRPAPRGKTGEGGRDGAPKVDRNPTETKISWIQDLAALRAKIKIKTHYSPDPGRDRPKTSHFLKDMIVRTLPRDPPGGEGTKNKIKNRLKHS